MLHHLFYIVNAEVLSAQRQWATENKLALQVNLSDKQALQNCYQKLHNADPGFSFCLCLSELQASDDEGINNIIAFFFIPKYYQATQAPVIIIENGDQKDFETFSAALVEGAAKQGFKRIHLIEKNLDKNSSLEYSVSEKEKLAHDYTQALKRSIEKSFYIAVSESTEIMEIEQMLERIESDFAAANEAVYNMQKENKALREKVEQLQYHLTVSEQEISHMASHMAVLSSTSQASGLQNYYNNEYEVLPRWYKQLGHVLKVIQGKRTFQSLFDKKAKKYRT